MLRDNVMSKTWLYPGILRGILRYNPARMLLALRRPILWESKCNFHLNFRTINPVIVQRNKSWPRLIYKLEYFCIDKSFTWRYSLLIFERLSTYHVWSDIMPEYQFSHLLVHR